MNIRITIWYLLAAVGADIVAGILAPGMFWFFPGAWIASVVFTVQNPKYYYLFIPCAVIVDLFSGFEFGVLSVILITMIPVIEVVRSRVNIEHGSAMIRAFTALSMIAVAYVAIQLVLFHKILIGQNLYLVASSLIAVVIAHSLYRPASRYRFSSHE